MQLARLAILSAITLLPWLHAGGAVAAVQAVPWDSPGVPAPVPLETSVDVAAYVFPGWPDADPALGVPGGQWPRLLLDPHVRPLLGFYNDELPEVADWQIYWARTFGVSLFIHNWYWNDGEQYLEGALEQGFLNAAHRDQIDFAIQWSNHPLTQAWGAETPLRFDRAAMLDVVDYWIANYFLLPNYRKVGGDRPLVVIFRPDSLIEGSGGVAGWLETLRQMNLRLAAAGLGDLWLVATSTAGASMAAAGFESITGYSTHGIAPVPCPSVQWGAGYSVPHRNLGESTRMAWETFREQQAAIHTIIPVGTGWNNTYRYPAGNGLRFTEGYEPAAFGALLAQSQQSLPAAGPRMVVVNAWNEWTEGAYLEPTRAFGFGLLEQVAATFGTGPVPAQAYHPTTARARELSALSAQAWNNAWNLPLSTPLPPYMDLPMVPLGYDCLLEVEQPLGEVLWEWNGGADPPPTSAGLEVLPSSIGFRYRPTTNDPQVVWSFPPVGSSQVGAIVFEVLVSTPGALRAQVFHAAPGSPFSGERTFWVRTPQVVDWQAMGVRVGDYAGWQAAGLAALRLDLGATGQTITVRRASIHAASPPSGWRLQGTP